MGGWVVGMPPSAGRQIKLLYLIWAGWAAEGVGGWFPAGEARQPSKKKWKTININVQHLQPQLPFLTFRLFVFQIVQVVINMLPRGARLGWVGGVWGPFADRKQNQ